MGADNDFGLVEKLFGKQKNKLFTRALVDFEKFEVVPGIVTGSLILPVSGKRPSPRVTVSLEEMTYVRQPEYWLIQVVGATSPTTVAQNDEFNASLDVTGLMGTKGLEIMGATMSKRWDIID